VTETDRGSGLRRWLVALALSGFISTFGIARAQELAPAIASADAPPDPSAETPAQAGPTQSAPPAPAQRNVSERTIFMNVLHDQKDLWLFPVSQLAHGHHWVPVVVVTGATAGLVALDPHDDPYFRRTASFSGFDRDFSGNITDAGILITPASFYLVGLFDKDAYTRKTGLLAAEALADVTILDEVMKGVTRRLRPSDIAPYGNFSDTFFKKKGDPFSSSFPSGHTISAFAVATVIAHRYRSHRWVPFVAYGVAGAIGFSRITLQAHFPSDVFLGAALGYAVARFDVLRVP
jgi:membrane-associated phospholipid phosphatase